MLRLAYATFQNHCTLLYSTHMRPEIVFVNRFRRPGIDFQPGGPVPQPYLLYLPARLRRLSESIPRNRFLGSLNVYKFGLSIFWHCRGSSNDDISQCSHGSFHKFSTAVGNKVVMATLAKRKRTKASIMVFSSISKRRKHLR